MPRSLQEIIEQAEELADRYENTNPDEFVNDPVLLLAHRRRIAIAAEAQLAEAVEQARDAGKSWEVIGKTIGVSKQAAAMRYRDLGGTNTRRRGAVVAVSKKDASLTGKQLKGNTKVRRAVSQPVRTVTETKKV